MKYRICYEKKGALIFISHLDVQKAFQRAFRRTDIRLAMSQGFHPHPKMTYSPPLPLFVASEEEYLDVALDTFFTEAEILEKLNHALPRDMRAKWVKMLGEHEPSLTDLLQWGQYRIILRAERAFTTADALSVEQFFEESRELLVEKKNKKGELLQKDIRPQIRALAASCTDSGEMIVTALLSMRNDNLLNPNVFIDVLQNRALVGFSSEVLECVKTNTIN